MCLHFINISTDIGSNINILRNPKNYLFDTNFIPLFLHFTPLQPQLAETKCIHIVHSYTY